MDAKEFLEQHGIPNIPTQFIKQFQTGINDTVTALEAYHQYRLKNSSHLNDKGSSLDIVKQIAFGDGSAQERMLDIKRFLNHI